MLPPAAPEPVAIDPAVARRDRIGIWVAWAVILLGVTAIVVAVSRSYAAREARDAGGPPAARSAATRPLGGAGLPVPSSDDDAAAAPEPVNPQLRFAAKYAVGAHRLNPISGPQLVEQLRDVAKTPAERLTIVPVVAELLGPGAALKELDRLPAGALRVADTTQAPLGRDAAILRAIYSRPAAAETGTQPSGTQPAETPPATTQNTADPATGSAADVAAASTPIDPADARRLRHRLGWFGRLALTYGQDDAAPDRQAILNEATSTFGLLAGMGTIACVGLLVGLVLLIVAIVLLAQRQIRLRYSESAAGPGRAGDWAASPDALPPGALPPPWAGYQPLQGGTVGGSPGVPSPGWPPNYSPPALPPGQPYPPGYGPTPYTAYPPLPYPYPPPTPAAPPYRLGPLRESNGRTGPFLEAFAIYLVGQILVSIGARLLLDERSLAINFVVVVPVLLALAWPRIRGVRGADYCRGFGFVAPRGVLRELGSGIVGYVAGLPVAALGLAVTFVLIRLTGATPTHPIVNEVAGGGPWNTVLLFALAAVWAPVVEEAFFRGALFHHLRTGWGWLMSALISSVIFAAVHPQGWSLIPGLAGLAIVFSAIREWRASTLAGMAAHALHNGALVTMLVVGMG